MRAPLKDVFGVGGAGVDKQYGAMDWLLRRRNRIQGKFAKRLFREDELVHCELISTCLEGQHYPLARFGHNRNNNRKVNLGSCAMSAAIRHRFPSIPAVPATPR